MLEYFTKFKGLLKRFTGNSDLGFVVGLFGAVLLLIVPVHKDILSVLLVFSIAISLLILLTVIYVKEPPEFSVFPTILLAVTLYRLGLNVASTRLILLEGDAGSVIQSFGTPLLSSLVDKAVANVVESLDARTSSGTSSW